MRQFWFVHGEKYISIIILNVFLFLLKNKNEMPHVSLFLLQACRYNTTRSFSFDVGPFTPDENQRFPKTELANHFPNLALSRVSFHQNILFSLACLKIS